MRWELPYLIAAEAACRTNDLTKAHDYLFSITDQRVKDGEAAAYATWKATLVDDVTTLEAIRHNWRIELWGEGYGLQTFRRYGVLVKLGDNHLRSKKEIVPTEARIFTFELPTGEKYYNPYIRQESNTSGTKSLRKQLSFTEY